MKKLTTIFCVFSMLLSVFVTRLPVLAEEKTPDIVYAVHVQTYGDQAERKNGELAGTEGESKRLESICIRLENTGYEGGVIYSTHVQSFGWLPEKKDGEFCGTKGLSKRLEAIKIRLYGEVAEHYDVYYRVHAQTYGWLHWAKNGEPAGTAGLSKRLEGIQIVLVEKGQMPPGAMAYRYVDYGKGKENEDAAEGLVNYAVHVQTYGDQRRVCDGAVSGTFGEAKRLEQIWISLGDIGCSGGVTYQTHVQTFGWMDWVSDGEKSGTSGQSKRLEAIKIKLYGEAAEKYDIYYRVHAQTYGWLGWAKNGEPAGSSGQAKRLEAIQIVLLPKGSEAPYGVKLPAHMAFDMEKLLKTAILPVGNTVYIWGGGWNEADDGAGVEAVTVGVSPRWKEFSDKQDSSYNYRNTRYQIHNGLDCSGYVGWLVYNVFNEKDGNKGYVMGADVQAKTFAGYGWGEYIPYGKGFKPGDICSMSDHVWVCLGSCEDGSVLLVHSSPPGVRICGTKLPNGEKSQAITLAENIMKNNYPEWYEKFPACSVNYSYLTTCVKMRWKTSDAIDPLGLQNMSAEEIAAYLFSK